MSKAEGWGDLKLPRPFIGWSIGHEEISTLEIVCRENSPMF